MDSQVGHKNIDSIINCFSKPYYDLYNPPAPAQPVASILVDSAHLRPK